MNDAVVGTTKGQIPFARVGEGATIVVLNGGQGFVRQATPDRLARDADRIARLLPPGRPFVLLGYDPAPDPYLTIDAVVRAMAEAIEEVAAGRQVDLVGISYGGMVACRVAASCPSLVRRMVLVSSAHRFSPRGEDHVRRQIALLENDDMAGFAKAFTGLFRRPLLNWLIGLTIRYRRRRVLSAMAPAEIIVRYLKAMLSAVPPDLAIINQPALLIGGSADQFFRDGIMEQAAAGMPSAELYILDGETHTAPVEQARAFEVKIGNFLSIS